MARTKTTDSFVRRSAGFEVDRLCTESSDVNKDGRHKVKALVLGSLGFKFKANANSFDLSKSH